MAQWPSASKRVPRVPVWLFPWQQHKCDASSAVASCGVERFLLVKMLNYRNAHYSREKMFECRMNFPPRAGLCMNVPWPPLPHSVCAQPMCDERVCGEDLGLQQENGGYSETREETWRMRYDTAHT